MTMGVFQVKMKNAIVEKRVYSVYTYTQVFPLFHEGVSEVSEGACEWSEQVKQVEESKALKRE